MNGMAWLLLVLLAATGAALAVRARRKWAERERAEAERFAAFMAATAAARKPADTPPVPPAAVPPAAVPPTALPPANEVTVQKLLFEAAHRAGEAGEPALAIQLYARLLVRYPSSGFADQARSAVELQKRKIAKS